MDPAIVARVRDAFKKTLDNPAVLAVFEKCDQSVVYLGTEDYTKFPTDSFASEKALIERLGMAGRGVRTAQNAQRN